MTKDTNTAVPATQPSHQQEESEPHGWLYDWTHSSATGKPDTTYTGFTKDEAHARKHENCTAVFTKPQPSPATQEAHKLMTNIPTDAEILAFAVEQGMRVRTGKGVVSFARAVLARWAQPAIATRITVPTNTMEQEFQNYHRRGFEAGKKANQPVERDPLPSIEIMRIVLEVEQQHNLLRGTTNWATAVGRAVERAHGIGGQHGTDA